jgi:hypothetical protein
MATAVAHERGFFGQVREPGDRFEVPDGIKEGSWFTIEEPEKPAPRKKGEKADPDQPADVI